MVVYSVRVRGCYTLVGGRAFGEVKVLNFPSCSHLSNIFKQLVFMNMISKTNKTSICGPASSPCESVYAQESNSQNFHSVYHGSDCFPLFLRHPLCDPCRSTAICILRVKNLSQRQQWSSWRPKADYFKNDNLFGLWRIFPTEYIYK